jgi:hypothetical protein
LHTIGPEMKMSAAPYKSRLAYKWYESGTLGLLPQQRYDVRVDVVELAHVDVCDLSLALIIVLMSLSRSTSLLRQHSTSQQFVLTSSMINYLK